MPRILNTLLFLPRLVRDDCFERIGYYPSRAASYPTRYLSQRSLALSCAAFGGARYVMYGIHGKPHLIDWSAYGDIREGDAVWLRIEDLETFNARVLPRVQHRFVLVTGASDYTVPADFPEAAETLARSGKALRWFSTNYDGGHADLITGMPLGFNHAIKTDLHFYGRWAAHGMTPVEGIPPREQEAAWERALRSAPPRTERLPLALADFHLNNSSVGRRYGETRAEIQEQLKANPGVTWLPRRVSLKRLLAVYAQHAFVVSPHGRALDCYRTWEALFAGCIPIVKTSPLDHLYRGLPVVILEDWREISRANLTRWHGRFGALFDGAQVGRTLSNAYWVSRVLGREAQ